jgi:hypothetical protein
MIGKDYKNLLRNISGYIGAIKKSTKLKIKPSDFFVKNAYRRLPKYSTRAGANKTIKINERNESV